MNQSDLVDMDVVFPLIKHNEVRNIAEIGGGTYGRVYHGFSLAVGNVAVKVCRMEDHAKLVQEVVKTIKFGAAHPNIVQVYGYFDHPRDGLSFVMELMTGGPLQKVLCNRTDLIYYVDHICSWMYQISSAVAHMHKCNVLHRDLKPDNVLMNELFTTVKLCDLGESRVLASNGEDMTSRVGSYLFMAPEVMMGHKYDGRIDVFSLGMVFWMMFARRLPGYLRNFKTPVAFITAVQSGARPSDLPILRVFNDLIKICMSPKPEDRFTSEQLRDFCADLVEKFPFGQNFLITMPESDRLYEPINVRGDVDDTMTPLIENPMQTVAATKPANAQQKANFHTIQATPVNTSRKPVAPPRQEKPVSEVQQKAADPALNALRETLGRREVAEAKVANCIDDPEVVPPSPTKPTTPVHPQIKSSADRLEETLQRMRTGNRSPQPPQPPQRHVRIAEPVKSSDEPQQHENVQRVTGVQKTDITKTINSIYVRSTRIPRNLVSARKSMYLEAAGGTAE